MAKKTKAKKALAVAGAILPPVLGIWIVFSERDLILPGSTLTGLALSVLIGAAGVGVFIKSIGYLRKRRGHDY